MSVCPVSLELESRGQSCKTNVRRTVSIRSKYLFVVNPSYTRITRQSIDDVSINLGKKCTEQVLQATSTLFLE